MAARRVANCSRTAVDSAAAVVSGLAELLPQWTSWLCAAVASAAAFCPASASRRAVRSASSPRSARRLPSRHRPARRPVRRRRASSASRARTDLAVLAAAEALELGAAAGRGCSVERAALRIQRTRGRDIGHPRCVQLMVQNSLCSIEIRLQLHRAGAGVDAYAQHSGKLHDHRGRGRLGPALPGGQGAGWPSTVMSRSAGAVNSMVAASACSCASMRCTAALVVRCRPTPRRSE